MGYKCLPRGKTYVCVGLKAHRCKTGKPERFAADGGNRKRLADSNINTNLKLSHDRGPRA
jgi:hypothetical protein